MTDIALPAKFNPYALTGVPVFEQWDQGVAAINTYNDKKADIEARRTRYKWLRIGSIILFVATVLEIVGLLFIIPWVIFSKKLRGLDDETNEAVRAYNHVWYAHLDMVGRAVANKLMPSGWTSYRTEQQTIIYNSDQFTYIDFANNVVVAYNNSDIKEVTLERVHTGAHTSGTANTYGGATALGDSGVLVGGGSTQSSSNTTDFYEWHLDVMTGYYEYPKVSLVVDDSAGAEDSLRKAYAILKPAR
ncbi:hypothetical protein [Lacticaseibacillus kribbianus]|uniref:hypothetical protein n=1 Tax=Lacticaseibacillus kribbianus TaxID=2926292 RepID=UPI001CD2D448|nr:hypothetical protein [Lacticaseibacillus kribbianus]